MSRSVSDPVDIGQEGAKFDWTEERLDAQEAHHCGVVDEMRKAFLDARASRHREFSMDGARRGSRRRNSPRTLQEWGALGRIHEDSRALGETAKVEEFSKPAVKDERDHHVGKTLSAEFESLLPLYEVPKMRAGVRRLTRPFARAPACSPSSTSDESVWRPSR
jgi:hypothetical protein